MRTHLILDMLRYEFNCRCWLHYRLNRCVGVYTYG